MTVTHLTDPALAGANVTGTNEATTPSLTSQDAVWRRLRAEAAQEAAREPTLASYFHAAILNHASLADALSYVLGLKLGADDLNGMQAREVFSNALNSDPTLVAAAAADMAAVLERDAACRVLLQPFLYFKGYQALQAHRVARWLWGQDRDTLAYHIQSRVSEKFHADIHPAAEIGKGVMIDHATGVVIGETARVGDDCSILQGVTLGGTGAKGGDRHPKIGRGVLIGAGANVLGNITIGDDAKIAAGSVVLKPVPARCTVAGVPARPVGGPCVGTPGKEMDQTIDDRAR